jgi:hypothetical protein
MLRDGDLQNNSGNATKGNATKGTGNMLVAFHEFVSWTWEKCEVVRLAGVERRDWHSAAGETEQQIARILTPKFSHLVLPTSGNLKLHPHQPRSRSFNPMPAATHARNNRCVYVPGVALTFCV